MNETNITKLSMDEINKTSGLTDWKKIEQMTDTEIEKLAQEDPDCQSTDDEFWQDAVIVKPDTLKLNSNGC